MPEWTCGRCTFINHELMRNCEMCDAPREAAEIPYLGNNEQPRSEESSTRSREGPTENSILIDHQTTQGPSADDMLDARSEMTTTSESQIQPGISQLPHTSLSGETEIDARNPSMDVTSERQEVVNGVTESPKLPEPLAPVVLHSLESQDVMESPMSEPEEINEAMCMPSPDKAMADEDNGWSFLENEVRLVLIGKTGVGKSTTGNNILGNKTFKSSASGASVTKKCQLGWASRFNRDIQIIDTPGLFDTGMSNEDISREIVKCIGMTSPGPHAFILVIRLDRFTAEEKATVDHFINIFGKDMLKYLIVLFTRMDDLKYDGTTLEEYVQNVPPDLKNLLEVCQHRRIGFDNRAKQDERDQDVQSLLKLVDNMVKGNGGDHYTNEMYEEAERIIAEQEEEHLKRNREEMKLEMQRLREEVEEELRKKDEQKQRDLEKMRGKLSELGIDEDEEWVQVFGTPSMSPFEEDEQEMMSLEFPARQNNDTSGVSSTEISRPVMVSGSVPQTEMQEVPAASESVSGTGKRDTTERKSADDYFKASDAKACTSRGNGSLTGSQQTGTTLQADSHRSNKQETVNRSYLANEPQHQNVRGGVSEHELEVQSLRERAVRMNEEHQRERERMRADYMAKQAAALDRYNRKHLESRQRTREELHNVNSNVFTRMFGAIKRVWKSITTPIARGMQSLFQGVHGRSSSSNGQTIF